MTERATSADLALRRLDDDALAAANKRITELERAYAKLEARRASLTGVLAEAGVVLRRSRWYVEGAMNTTDLDCYSTAKSASAQIDDLLARIRALSEGREG